MVASTAAVSSTRVLAVGVGQQVAAPADEHQLAVDAVWAEHVDASWCGAPSPDARAGTSVVGSWVP